MRYFPGALAVAVVLAVVVGCGRGDRPSLGTVRGQVTLDGKPLAGVTVSFQPADGGRQSAGVTDEEGRYELIYLRDIKGAKVGNHRVLIGGSDKTTPPKERLPARYNAQTTLTADVQPSENQCDFPLTSR